MLACASSHLCVATSQDLNAEALHHRSIAVEGLSQNLGLMSTSEAASDALLATCYALAMQSLYLHGTLYEYLVMVRGCGLITNRVRAAKGSSNFITIPRLYKLEPGYEEKYEDEGQPLIDMNIAQGMRESLDAVQYVCTTDGERALYRLLPPIADALFSSPLKGIIFDELQFERRALINETSLGYWG